MWKTLGGTKVPNLTEWVREATREGQSVHIGTDSLQTGKYTQFVTVVVIHTPGKGGRVAYRREVLSRITSLRERLLKEVWRSVEVGMTLTQTDITIHVDANPSEKHMSGRYVEELVGLVVGQGFKHKIKPDSWAASHAADHVVRFKGRLPKLEDVA